MRTCNIGDAAYADILSDLEARLAAWRQKTLDNRVDINSRT